LPSRSRIDSLFQFSFFNPLTEQLPKSWVRLQLLSQLATLEEGIDWRSPATLRFAIAFTSGV